MKRFILSFIIFPIAGQVGFNNAFVYSTTLVQVRSGDWPISLEKNNDYSEPSFSLIFRDQQVIQDVVMDTIPFPNLTQLKYLEQALTALKKGNNGDIARFKEYSINRADVKKDGIWYVLHHRDWGVTNFKQPEADVMIETIRKL